MSRFLRPVLFVALLLLVSWSLAAEPVSGQGGWYALQDAPAHSPARLESVEAVGDGLRLELSVPGFEVRTVATKAGPRALLEIPQGAVTAKLGSPKLPVLRYLIETPPGAKLHLGLTASSWRRLSLRDLGLDHPILPVQHPVPKIEGAADQIPFVQDGVAYAQDAFLPADAVAVVDRAVIRGRHVAQIEIRPLRYNSVSGMIEVWNSAELQVSFEGGLPESMRRESSRVASGVHDRWIDSAIISAPASAEAAATRGRAGGAAEGAAGMLVVCHDDFAAAVAPLLDWKEQTGYKVELLLISEIGTSPSDADVKAAIQARYDSWSEPPLDYVMMVGDTDFTPIHTGSGGGNSQVTDHWYACLDGPDYLPEVAIARISTRTAQETTDAVNKLLTYEQATFATTEWIKAAGFIGTEDTGHISLIEGTHDDCIDDYMTPNGYLPTSWSHGGDSCDRHYNTYNASTADISDSINQGRSWINYSGHGYTGGWSGAVSGQGYDSSLVMANTNAGMYPFVISNACQTSMIGTTECYAEVWQKAPERGAIGHWGASNNSYWDEDDVLQRALYTHLFPMDDTEPLGVMVNLTKLDLYNYYGDVGNVAYYYDMYTLLSDPTLVVWTRAPRDLDCVFDGALPIGESTFNISCSFEGAPVENALVAVRKLDEGVFEAGYTDASGALTLTMDPAPDGVGDLEVTVTGPDWRPLEQTAVVIAPDTPWLIHRAHLVDDTAGGDGDGQANPGESLVVPVTVENVGEQPGSALAGTLTTSTPAWCEILDGSASFPDLAPHTQGDSLPDHYGVRVLPDAPDGVMLGFDLAWTASGGASGTTSFRELVRAVDLAYTGHAVDDTVAGNGNGVAGPGETVEMVVSLASTGHRDASGITGTLSTSSPYVTILQDSSGYPDLGAGSQGDSLSAYSFEIAAGAPDQQPVTFDLTLAESGSGYAGVVQFDVMISSCAGTDSTDVPYPINDSVIAESTLTYNHAIAISDLNVFVDIAHTYQGDLTVTLESPEGVQVLLHNRSGGGADNIVTWYDTETAPAESLDVLNGESSFGTWKLIVEDHAGGDSGTLDGWSLEVCGEAIAPVPRLFFEGWSMDDIGTCDPDNVADVGETVVYNLTVRNNGWGIATGVSATLFTDALAAAVNGPVALPDLAVGEAAVAPVEVLIGAVGCKESIAFTVDMAANEGEWFDGFSDRVEWDEIDSTDLEDIEQGGAAPAGWSHDSISGPDDWAVVGDLNHTSGGSYSWFSAVSASISDDYLVSPEYLLSGTPDMVATLEFWHTVSLDGATDGGLLEISDDGGASWTDAGPFITEGGYNGTFDNSTHGMDGRSVWTGNSSWKRTVVDIASWRDQSVSFRWRLGSGFFGTGTGWWIDDVVVGTHDEPCDTHACGIPGEVRLDRLSKEAGEVVLEWWEDPLCVDFRVWRSSDPSSAGGFVDVTTEDPDSTDCIFRDADGGAALFWIIEAIGPDGVGPWGHYGQ